MYHTAYDPDKMDWWKLGLWGVYNIYNISISFENSNNYGEYSFIIDIEIFKTVQ